MSLLSIRRSSIFATVVRLKSVRSVPMMGPRCARPSGEPARNRCGDAFLSLKKGFGTGDGFRPGYRF